MVGHLYDSEVNMVSILIGFSIAVLSGLGVGSGGLFVIWLTLIEGVQQIYAQGLNLLFFLFSAGASLLIHVSKRKILWPAVFFLIAVGIIGSLFGSFIAGFIPSLLMRKLFGAMLVISGMFSVLRKKSVK